MRPLRVAMEAFGPYAGRQVLDFADLHGRGFFLITGTTGSGKTTVLDAMSFALYGVTSGGPESEGGRSGASMRSDHADPGLLTRVVFDFALGADLYRIVREPEQERPKARGEGTTTHGQTATIWRLRRAGPDGDGPGGGPGGTDANGPGGSHGGGAQAAAGPEDGGTLAEEGKPLATGWTRVSAEAERLLGFRSEQFRQVVMLPQGRFQKLLEADSKEREAILRALFDTGHYSLIEQTLKDEAATLRKAAEKIGIRRQEILHQSGAETVDGLAERRALLAVEAGEADAGALRAEAARDRAQAELAGGRDAAARLAELDGATAAAAAVHAGAGAVAEQRRRRDEAERAAALSDAYRRAATARSRLTERRATSVAAQADHAARAEALRVAVAALARQEERAPEREAVDADVLRLKSMVGATAGLAEARAAARRTEARLATARDDAGAADAAWRQAQHEAERADALLREAHAGLLAHELRDGEPCPVCGAREHPAPAALPAETPAAAEVEALRGRADELLRARDAAAAVLHAAEAELAAETARVAEREKAAPPEFADPAALAAAVASRGAARGVPRGRAPRRGRRGPHRGGGRRRGRVVGGVRGGRARASGGRGG